MLARREAAAAAQLLSRQCPFPVRVPPLEHASALPRRRPSARPQPARPSAQARGPATGSASGLVGRSAGLRRG